MEIVFAKVGDIVRVKSLEEIKQSATDQIGDDAWVVGTDIFTEEMTPLCGKCLRVVNIFGDGEEFLLEGALDSQGHHWLFTLDMVKIVGHEEMKDEN